MITKERVEITVSTTCECTYCVTCRIGSCGAEKCEECGGAMTYSPECYECQPYDYLQEEIEAWIKHNNASKLAIFGKNMGWNHYSGEAHTPASYRNVIDCLTINGEYTLYFTIDKNEPIQVRRTSHDEPTGATFEVFRHVRSYQRKGA